ncbi:MAG: hypothetical protein R2769_01755 [Saprospiraceae bacterium]
MVVQMVKDFIASEIDPVAERLEKQEPGLSVSLLEKAAELGLWAPICLKNMGEWFETPTPIHSLPIG